MSDDQNIDFRMDAYYYGFDKTGERSIDRILSAVAWAGKAFHSTDQWNEEAGERPGHEGITPVEWMQSAGKHAASELSILRSGIAASQAECEWLKGALRLVCFHRDNIDEMLRIARDAIARAPSELSK
jgi:hypothetical protein